MHAENIKKMFFWFFENRDDFSQPGHILGSAEGRSTQATSERTLSPSSNTLLRLLTHMAMLIGANDHLNVNIKNAASIVVLIGYSTCVAYFFTFISRICANYFHQKYHLIPSLIFCGHI